MKKRVFNLIILDESGSMCSIEQQAIGGVNETLQTIRAAQNRHNDQTHYVSLVSFNSTQVKTIFDKIEAERVEELDGRMYCPSSCTPLYDAMGNALTALRKSVTDDDTVLVTIVTDGYENASTEYNGPDIKKLVESLKAKGWIFTYIGANQNVEEVAQTISITNTMTFQASAEGTSAMWAKENTARNRFFDRIATEGCCESMADDYFSES